MASGREVPQAKTSVSGGLLIPYLREDLPGPKRSDCQILPVADADLVDTSYEGLHGPARAGASGRAAPPVS
jgi:hypothetical protein